MRVKLSEVVDDFGLKCRKCSTTFTKETIQKLNWVCPSCKQDFKPQLIRMGYRNLILTTEATK